MSLLCRRNKKKHDCIWWMDDIEISRRADPLQVKKTFDIILLAAHPVLRVYSFQPNSNQKKQQHLRFAARKVLSKKYHRHFVFIGGGTKSRANYMERKSDDDNMLSAVPPSSSVVSVYLDVFFRNVCTAYSITVYSSVRLNTAYCLLLFFFFIFKCSRVYRIYQSDDRRNMVDGLFTEEITHTKKNQ